MGQDKKRHFSIPLLSSKLTFSLISDNLFPQKYEPLFLFYIINSEKLCENYSHAKKFFPTDLFFTQHFTFPYRLIFFEKHAISQGSYHILEDQPIVKFQALYEMLVDSKILP